MSVPLDGQNLSEVLFKPRFNYEETSIISNGGCELPKLDHHDRSLGFAPDFYRPVRSFLWVFSGGNLLDIDEALANISTSKQERTRTTCLDTVKEYGPGNWIYEFNSIAQRRENLGKDFEIKGEILKASHQYRMASRYYSIAAYPFLKGDVLASEAQIRSRRIYKQMIDLDPTNGVIQEETFTVRKEKVTGFLHLPNSTDVHPCVILSGSYEQNVSDFYRYYNEFLRPRGIAVFVIDMPGFGLSSKIVLDDDFSCIIDAALEHLQGIKNVDSTHIGLIGFRLSGAACIREAILNPNKIKAISVISPIVNALFNDQKLLNSFPLCLRSIYANRLNLNAANWDTIIPQLRALSLKTQGLLSSSGRCSVPCHVNAVRNSFTTADDIKLLEGNFRTCQIDMQDDNGYSEFLLKSLNEAANFLQKYLLE